MVGLNFAEAKEAGEFFDILMKKLARSQKPKTTVKSTSVKQTPKKINKNNSKKGKRTIGAPSNFRHLAHIGFDPSTGFDVKNIPPEWKALFDKAGVTKEQLENKETAKFIVDFVQSKGGPQAKAPPAPARTIRGPPPIPPARKRPETVIKTVSPAPVAPAVPSIPVAPKVPDLPSRPAEGASTSNQSERIKPHLSLSSIPPERESLMDSIRKSHATLLKPVQVTESSPPEESSGGIAEMLAKALSDRNKVVGDSDSDSDDEEW